jgi:hypothetical protein
MIVSIWEVMDNIIHSAYCHFMNNLALHMTWDTKRYSIIPRKHRFRFICAILPFITIILAAVPGFNSEAATEAKWEETILYEGYGANLEWRSDVAALKPEKMPVILTFTIPTGGRCRMNLILPVLSGTTRSVGLPTKVVLGVLSRQNSNAEWSHALKAVELRHSQEITFPCRGGDEVRIYAVANMDRALGTLPGQPVRLNMDIFLQTTLDKPVAAVAGGIDSDFFETLLRDNKLQKPSPPDATIQKYMVRFPPTEFRDTASYHGAVPLAPRSDVTDRVGLVYSWYSRRETMGGTKSEGFVCQMVVLSERDWDRELTGGQELGFGQNREVALEAARKKIVFILRK